MDKTFELAPADLQLLHLLQEDPRLSMADLAERTSTSVSACWRRVKRLEDARVIERYSVNLNRKALGFGIEAFVFVRIASHVEAQAVQFEQSLLPIRNILSCHILSGHDDYLLRVVAKDLDDYAHFGRKVLALLPHVKEVRSAFVLHTIKDAPSLPIGP